jgi:hypothetical protein
MTWPFATRQDFDLRKMGSRMLKAARLDGETYRELRDDPHATAQAVSLIAIIGLCYGSGLGISGFLISGTSSIEILTITLIGLLAAILVAFAWSGTTFLIVTKIFRGKITYLGLARPFFFSWSPGLLLILTSNPIPTISEIFRVAPAAWIGIANVFAVKNVVGFSTQQSMLTFIICVLLLALVVSILPLS